MRIDATEDRMVVISDLHVGNPFSLATQKLQGFVDYLLDEGMSVCINGDGLDILQSRFHVLASQTLEIVELLRRLSEADLGVYYVVGNHDVALEGILSSWLGDYLSPFLNLRSGPSRVRIEHGHIYDPLYIASPRVYAAAGALAAPFLRLYPDVYKVWSGISRLRMWRQKRHEAHRVEWRPSEIEAADMVAERGFDVVVMGHTHRPERVELPSGAVYLNSGNWLRDSTFVSITDGVASLQHWDPRRKTCRPAGT